MGLPYFLEKEIKKLIYCCASASNLLRRPNDESFIVVNNKSTVGPHNLPNNVTTSVQTGQYYKTNEVYESFGVIDLATDTSPVIITTNAATLIGADIIYIDGATSDQIYSNGTDVATFDGILSLSGGDIILTWSTTHSAGDGVTIFVRHTIS